MGDEPKIDWQAFCLLPETACYYSGLGKPFVQDGYLYATNGHVVIRRKTRSKRKPSGVVPIAGYLPWGGKGPWRPWPKLRIRGGVQKIGKVHVAGRYVRLICDLPSVEYALSHIAWAPLAFRFKGGEGLIMPYSVT